MFLKLEMKFYAIWQKVSGFRNHAKSFDYWFPCESQLLIVKQVVLAVASKLLKTLQFWGCTNLV